MGTVHFPAGSPEHAVYWVNQARKQEAVFGFEKLAYDLGHLATNKTVTEFVDIVDLLIADNTRVIHGPANARWCILPKADGSGDLNVRVNPIDYRGFSDSSEADLAPFTARNISTAKRIIRRDGIKTGLYEVRDTVFIDVDYETPKLTRTLEPKIAWRGSKRESATKLATEEEMRLAIDTIAGAITARTLRR